MDTTELAPQALWTDPRIRSAPSGNRWLLRILIPLLAFVIYAPSLPLDPTFHGAIEQLNVATALEMRREGNYLFPTLLGSWRMAKPPITAWLTAAAIRESTLRDLASSDEATNARGLRELAWDVRWPACLALCIMLWGVFELGTIIGGTWLGTWSALIAGTTVLFVRHVHTATIDPHFSAVIVWANVMLAYAITRPQRWGGWIGAGIAIGLGMFFKGPVALLLTVLPVGAFMAARHNRRDPDAPPPGLRRHFAKLAVCILLASIVGFWWYALVLLTRPGMAQFWFNEVLDPTVSSYPWYKYIDSMKLLLPWLPLVIIGLWHAGRRLAQRKELLEALPAFLFVLPLVVMSFHIRRYDRYVLPMVGPAGVLAGIVSAELAWRWLRPDLRKGRTIAAGLVVAAALSVGAWSYYYSEQEDPKNAFALAPMAQVIRRDYPDAELLASYPASKLMLFLQGTQISIHLNRTIRWTADPALPPGERVQILFRPRSGKQTLPALPPSWQVLQECHDDRTFVEMAIRRPASAQ